jgi:CheY-like chemotaxis protein
MMVLRSLGYRCRAARDGEEALREFDSEPAAIVLSDWCMSVAAKIEGVPSEKIEGRTASRPAQP